MTLGMRLLSTLSALSALLLAGCGSDTAPAAPATAAPDANNPVASMDSIPPAALLTDSLSANYDEPVTLIGLTNGDVACYLTVRTAAGEERTELADFRLCERTDLEGTRVLLTATPSPIQARSCGGDPECRDTEQVNLVTGIDPAGADLPPAPPPDPAAL